MKRSFHCLRIKICTILDMAVYHRSFAWQRFFLFFLKSHICFTYGLFIQIDHFEWLKLQYSDLKNLNVHDMAEPGHILFTDTDSSRSSIIQTGAQRDVPEGVKNNVVRNAFFFIITVF